jgi:hypothetical protein
MLHQRQPRRPHYLAKYMERHGVRRTEIIGATGVDKASLSKWLAPVRPATPSPEWANRLGEFFERYGGPVDIFVDPDVAWFARMIQGRSPDEVERMKKMLELAFPTKPVG